MVLTLIFQNGLLAINEIGELADFFNKMTKKLQNITVSRNVLSEEIEVRKKAEERIVTEKEKLIGIVEGIEAGLMLLDTKSRIIWINENLKNWFGPIEKLRGRPCHELYGLKNLEKESVAFHSLASGKVEKGEFPATTVNGERRYFQLTAAPVQDKDDRIVQIVLLTQDITERNLANSCPQVDRYPVALA